MLVDTPITFGSPFPYFAPATSLPMHAYASDFTNMTSTGGWMSSNRLNTESMVTQQSTKRKCSWLEEPDKKDIRPAEIAKRLRVDPTQVIPSNALVLYTPPEQIIQESIAKHEQRNADYLMEYFSI